MTRRVEILNHEVAYQGFFRVLRYRLCHELFEGGLSAPIDRECLFRGHAVGVLAYDPHRDEVALVEQFRIGAVADSHDPWILEVIAGLIEPGETAEEVASREALEEADCPLGELQPIARYFSSPGSASEQVTLFCAQVDTARLGGIHGCRDEGEDIRVRVLHADEAIAMLDQGSIRAAMPLIALQWLARHRERLQQRWVGE